MNEIPKINEVGTEYWGDFEYQALHNAYEERGLLAQKGDKIIPSYLGLETFPRLHNKTAKVVGFGRGGRTLRIKINGKKTIYSYWAGFWMKKENE